MLSHQKVGGLHFIRIGRVSISWCIVKKRREGKVAKVLSVVDHDMQHDEHMYDRAAHEAMLEWEKEVHQHDEHMYEYDTNYFATLQR